MENLIDFFCQYTGLNHAIISFTSHCNLSWRHSPLIFQIPELVNFFRAYNKTYMFIAANSGIGFGILIMLLIAIFEHQIAVWFRNKNVARFQKMTLTYLCEYIVQNLPSNDQMTDMTHKIWYFNHSYICSRCIERHWIFDQLLKQKGGKCILSRDKNSFEIASF